MYNNNKILLTDVDQLQHSCEFHIWTNIYKDDFFKLAKKYEVSLENIFIDKPTLRDCYKFNFFLRKLKEKHGFQIKDVIMYLEENYTKFKKIVKLLDDRNMYLLKQEIAKTNKRFRLKRNILIDFIEEFDD